MIDLYLVDAKVFSDKEDVKWLVFLEKREWIVQVNPNGYTWFNFDFFGGLFAYFSIDMEQCCQLGAEIIKDWIKTRLGLPVTQIYPDKFPNDYDWSDEFDVNEVLSIY